MVANYCGEWYEFFPNPPFNVLNGIDTLLQHHCPALLRHYTTVGATAQVRAPRSRAVCVFGYHRDGIPHTACIHRLCGHEWWR